MRAHENWSWRPYRPPFFDTGEPYLCRVAPDAGRIALEWLPNGSGEYEVLFREKGEEGFRSAGRTAGTEFVLESLTDGRDYEFCVASDKGRSRVRLGKCGRAVGTVVNYLHPEDDAYLFSGKALCSPSLVRLPDGTLLASMDVFRADWPQVHHHVGGEPRRQNLAVLHVLALHQDHENLGLFQLDVQLAASEGQVGERLRVV